MSKTNEPAVDAYTSNGEHTEIEQPHHEGGRTRKGHHDVPRHPAPDSPQKPGAFRAVRARIRQIARSWAHQAAPSDRDHPIAEDTVIHCLVGTTLRTVITLVVAASIGVTTVLIWSTVAF